MAQDFGNFSFMGGATGNELDPTLLNPEQQAFVNAPTGQGFDAPPQAGGSGISNFFSDPNMLQLLAKLGSGISQGQPFGQAAGDATSNLLRNQALQGGAANISGRRGSLVDELVKALRDDPTGKGLLGPKEDRKTLDSITLTNDGINIKAPNPSVSNPFENITDQSLESQPGESSIDRAAPRLGETADAFPFL